MSGPGGPRDLRGGRAGGHPDTARICYVIADELYGRSVHEAFGGDKALLQQIHSQSRQQVIEAFAALGYAPYIAAPVEESRAGNG